MSNKVILVETQEDTDIFRLFYNRGEVEILILRKPDVKIGYEYSAALARVLQMVVDGY